MFYLNSKLVTLNISQPANEYRWKFFMILGVYQHKNFCFTYQNFKLFDMLRLNVQYIFLNGNTHFFFFIKFEWNISIFILPDVLRFFFISKLIDL